MHAHFLAEKRERDSAVVSAQGERERSERMELKTTQDKRGERRNKQAQSPRWEALFCFRRIRAEVVICVRVCVRASVSADERIEVLCMGIGACDCA